jgi:hypothetical protein
MKFFLRLKIYEVIEEHGSKVYTYHHGIAILSHWTSLVPTAGDLTEWGLVQMDLEQRLLKNVGGIIGPGLYVCIPVLSTK